MSDFDFDAYLKENIAPWDRDKYSGPEARKFITHIFAERAKGLVDIKVFARHRSLVHDGTDPFPDLTDKEKVEKVCGELNAMIAAPEISGPDFDID